MTGRVLIIAGNLGRFGETDGVVTTYWSLLPLLAEAGLEADVVGYGPESRIDRMGSLRIFTHKPVVPAKIDPHRWIDLFPVFSSTARELRNTKYVAVQSSSPCPLGLLGVARARANNAPLIGLYHTALDHYVEIRSTTKWGKPIGKLFGGIMHFWLNVYYNQSALILTPSQHTRDEVRGRLKPRVEVLSRGVDGDRFHPRHRTRPLDDRPVEALYVGRVAYEKNLQQLGAMFGGMPDLNAVIVGDGPYYEAMQKEYPNFRYLGRLKGEALSTAYANGDFFVFPSHTDTLGNVVLEGLSSGLPAVVYDSMGPKELIEDRKTGFIARSDEEFAQAVRLLATDHDLRNRMKIAARAAAELRTWKAIADQLIGYYEQVTGRSLTESVSRMNTKQRLIPQEIS